MPIQNLYESYEADLVCKKAGENTPPTSRNTFFEMVFVLRGKGVQYINDLSLPYAEDKLFLIFPEDTYGFEVEEDSDFFVLRFSLSFIQGGEEEWRHKLEYIFQHHNHLPGCILKHTTDKPLIRALAEALLREKETQGARSCEVNKMLVSTIITIAARNIEQAALPCDDFTPINGITRILHYIHQHISQPESLKISVMASYFHISETYFTEFFKKRTGQSPQQYILSYKQRLIERKLQFSTQRLTEIAYSMGFNDASHFNHFFKKQTGISPIEYRNRFKERG